MKEYIFIVDSVTPRMNYVFNTLSATNTLTIKYDDNAALSKLNCSPAQKKIYVFSPTYKINQSVLNKISCDSIIFCGKVFLDDNTYQPQQKIFSYLQDNNFVKINSKITSEGALQLIISNTSLSLFDSNVLILGYGNLARQLAIDFSFFAKKIAIATYSKKELQESSLHYESFYCTAFMQSLPTFDVVINTIPTTLFERCSTATKTSANNKIKQLSSPPPTCIKPTSSIMSNSDPSDMQNNALQENKIINFKQGGLFLDLASTSCFDAGFMSQNIDYIQALGLPDKTSPESAGKYIANFVLENLKQLQKSDKEFSKNDEDFDNQEEITFLLT